MEFVWWYPYELRSTIGVTGSENGLILRDEEYGAWGASRSNAAATRLSPSPAISMVGWFTRVSSPLRRRHMRRSRP
jgi:hypothetical protein